MTPVNRLPALVVPLALVLCGCPHRVDFGARGEPKSAEEILQRVAAAELGVYSIKGEARLRVDSAQTKGVVTLFAAVTHPALIHLESLDFFGKPQGVLVSDGATFGLYDGQAGKYFRGPATAENVARFVPILLPPAELAALLLGRAPRLPSEGATLRFDADQGAFLLTLQHGKATQVLTVKPPSYRVTHTEVTGVDAYSLDFENIEEVGAATYPRRVVLTATAAGVRIELNYKDVAVNEPPDLSLYEQKAPVNVPVVEVDGRGLPREPVTP